LSRARLGGGVDCHAAKPVFANVAGGRFGLFNGAGLGSARRSERSAAPHRDGFDCGSRFFTGGAPDIHRMEDLKGKILAVSGVGEFTDVGTRMVLKKYGLV